MSAAVNSTYNLFQYTSFLSGTLSSPIVGLPTGYTGHLVNSSPYIQLVIDTIPAAPVLAISSATASPATITPSGNTSFSVTVANGTAPYTVTVDYSLLKGHAADTDVQTLRAVEPATFTGSAVTPVNTLAVGTYSLPVNVTDSTTADRRRQRVAAFR